MNAGDRLAARLPARRVWVTGAASGLGLEVIRQLLASSGQWSIAMIDLNAAKLEAARASLVEACKGPHQLHSYALDVRDLDAQKAAGQAFVAVAGGIDLALNAAGVAATGAFLEGSPQDWDWAFDINLHGVANSCRTVLPPMLKQHSGLIINVASAASFCTGPMMGAYNASKAAVVALSETLMQEYGPKGVQTLVAMPGFFRTNLLADARGPAKLVEGARRIMEQSQLEVGTVAEALLLAAARGRNHWTYPARYRNLWRLKRLIPSRFQRVFPALVRRGI
jgi:NAD(P)-dependent dehydrogenase (short-subunit alcohol dehydrogenase family)